MIKQTAFKLITILALLASIGGCTINSKEQKKQVPIATSSTSREDKEAINKKTNRLSERTRARNDGLCEST